jgi:hypothetical protein
MSIVEVSDHELESDWIERARIDDATDYGVLGKRRQNVNISLVFGPKENGPVAVMDEDLGQADLSSALLNEPDHLEKNNWNDLKSMLTHRDEGGDAELPTCSGKRDETQRVRQAETDVPASNQLALESIVQLPQDSLDGFRTQYLEALYISKVWASIRIIFYQRILTPSRHLSRISRKVRFLAIARHFNPLIRLQ